MRQIHVPACSIVLLYALSGAMALSADGGPGVSGQLTFSDVGMNCDGVEVSLEHSFGLIFRQTYTDLLCNFSFSDVDPSVYYLHVALP